MIKPLSVNILGTEYTIEYCNKPSEVDIYKRESLWGQIDYWTRTIRIYENDRINSDLWQTLIHEILHGIVVSLKIKELQGKENEDKIDLLALGLTDVLFRNRFLKEMD